MMLSLLRRIWRMHAQTIWLWRIDIEINRYHKLKQKMARRRNAINELTNGYDETFGEKSTGKEVTA